MNKPRKPPGLFQRLRARAAPAADAADMGTAYGMEMSLGASPSRTPAPAAPRPAGWLRRLGRRSKATP